MKVTGLSGKSGTGKSYNAIELSAKLGIDAIIDDGLFICSGSIAAGISAKKQKTKIGAIKTALFSDDEHRDSVRLAIDKHQPKHILVLGTSDEMIKQITERLALPAPEEIIQIEDITTPEQREKAHQLRNEAGMHTIPAPTFQVRKQFSGLFIDPKRAFKADGLSGEGSENREKKSKKKTIVRPTYSYLGAYEISAKVIDQIVAHVIQTTDGCAQLLWSASINGDDGMYIRAIITTKKGAKMKTAAELVQKRILNTVEHMTAFKVLGVEVEIHGYK